MRDEEYKIYFGREKSIIATAEFSPSEAGEAMYHTHLYQCSESDSDTKALAKIFLQLLEYYWERPKLVFYSNDAGFVKNGLIFLRDYNREPILDFRLVPDDEFCLQIAVDQAVNHYGWRCDTRICEMKP